MAKCKFRLGKWECPLKPLPGEEYCYWHKEEEGKEPDDTKLGKLKNKEIVGIFLRKAKLAGKDLRNAYLEGANLQEAHLFNANLQGAYLLGANLQGAYLSVANLQGAKLGDTNLQGANLFGANLQGAEFWNAKLQEANLSDANLQGADLWHANLKGANLMGVIVDSRTNLTGADLTYANLYLSYIDETKTLRNAKFKIDKEINEIVADALRKKNMAVLDMEEIKKANSEVASRLLEEGLVRYVPGVSRIVLFDKKKMKIVRIPKEESLIDRIKRFIKKGGNSKKEDYYIEISELNDLIEREGIEKFLYKGSRKELYEASYEVYNNLYYFYIQNGRLDEALQMHCRRGEVRRKLLRVRGGIYRLGLWILDSFVLKGLTGYGVKICRPIIVSTLTILFYAFAFWLTHGIVKNVNGINVTPTFFDCLYHSVITFTTLGYANIHPHLAVLPQFLVASESILGALMIALLIFVITYRVSR